MEWVSGADPRGLWASARPTLGGACHFRSACQAARVRPPDQLFQAGVALLRHLVPGGRGRKLEWGPQHRQGRDSCTPGLPSMMGEAEGALCSFSWGGSPRGSPASLRVAGKTPGLGSGPLGASQSMDPFPEIGVSWGRGGFPAAAWPQGLGQQPGPASALCMAPTRMCRQKLGVVLAWRQPTGRNGAQARFLLFSEGGWPSHGRAVGLLKTHRQPMLSPLLSMREAEELEVSFMLELLAPLF